MFMLAAALAFATGWLADFTQIRNAMSAHYANLEWAATVRHVDLAKTAATATRAIETQSTLEGERKAIEAFLAAFGDGHLVIDWPQRDSGAARPLAPCAALGYSPPKHPSKGLAFASQPGYAPVSNSAERYFPTATMALPNGGSLGLLRIPIFDARWYPELCDQALSELRAGERSNCDDACADRLQLAAENELTKNLTSALEALERTPNLKAIAVDITANGGGSDWLEPAARELTAKPLLSPRLGFIKHPHWSSEFRTRLAVVSADLKKASSSYRELLDRAERTYFEAERVSSEPCDLAPLWADEVPSCSLVANAGLFTTGTLPYAAPGSLPRVASAQYLFSPSRYAYREGVYRGALMVLVDGNTASAAERFASILQDNGVAHIVGSPTFGAGCGYTNGGITETLSNSKAVLRMPDCVQYRKDASNAVAGVTPDVLVAWRDNDTSFQRAQRALDAILTLL